MFAISLECAVSNPTVNTVAPVAVELCVIWSGQGTAAVPYLAQSHCSRAVDIHGRATQGEPCWAGWTEGPQRECC